MRGSPEDNGRQPAGGAGYVRERGVAMPWFPDFVSAVELARKQTRAAGQDDPVGQYFTALNKGDTRIETVASTSSGGRAVVELLAHLDGDGQQLAWPVAVVAESPDELSVVFRTYCSQWPVDGRRHLRPPILEPGTAHPGDIVGRYQAALEAGDADSVVSTFEPDGYYREPIGPHATHSGTDQLRTFFAGRFSAGGGIELEHCAVTDDGVRCALEYNCVRWGSQDLAPQAGLGVYERGPDGLLAAARVYDDIEPPR